MYVYGPQCWSAKSLLGIDCRFAVLWFSWAETQAWSVIEYNLVCDGTFFNFTVRILHVGRNKEERGGFLTTSNTISRVQVSPGPKAAAVIINTDTHPACAGANISNPDSRFLPEPDRFPYEYGSSQRFSDISVTSGLFIGDLIRTSHPDFCKAPLCPDSVYWFECYSDGTTTEGVQAKNIRILCAMCPPFLMAIFQMAIFQKQSAAIWWNPGPLIFKL